MKDDNFDFFSNSVSDNLEENLDHNNNELLNLNNLTANRLANNEYVTRYNLANNSTVDNKKKNTSKI